jgi:hypothetical protein
MDAGTDKSRFSFTNGIFETDFANNPTLCSSVLHMFNTVLISSSFPAEWKKYFTGFVKGYGNCHAGSDGCFC